MNNEKLRADTKRELNQATSMKKLAEQLNRCYVALGGQQSVPVKITDQMNQTGAAYQRERVKGLVEALEAFDAATKESTTIIGLSGKARKLLTNARKALATYKAQEGK